MEGIKEVDGPAADISIPDCQTSSSSNASRSENFDVTTSHTHYTAAYRNNLI